MATALRLSDSNRSTRSHKILTQKRRPEGFEAPRNSLEVPPESYQGYHEIYENVPFACIIKNPYRKASILAATPVKKFIEDEMSGKVNCRRNAPSVVARLMGMESLPSEASTSSDDRLPATSRNREQRHGQGEAGFARYKPLELGPFGLQRDALPLSKHAQDTAAPTTSSSKAGKPQRREHPQEDQLQIFKKEFEAWQLQNKREQNKDGRLERSPPGWREHPAFSKGNSLGERVVSHVSSQPKFSHQKVSRFSDPNNSKQRVGFYHDIDNTKCQSSGKPASGNRMPRMKIGGFHVVDTTEILDESLPTANIVILKPNAEYIDDFRETWANSPEIVEKVGSIEHFLEEVKERLRLEVQGKPSLDVATQGSTGGSILEEKHTDPKCIAQHIARQVRESISREFETTLTRSKSSRTYKSEDWCSLSDSFESISKENKKTFLRRLKNAHKTLQTNEFPLDTSGRRNMHSLAKKVNRSVPITQCSAVENFSLDNTSNQLYERSTASFRLEDEKAASLLTEPSSLSRSYSAPLSRTAFGKLLLEDQHILNGGRIHRMHESDGTASTTMRRKQRDGFNFKNKVSNLRHNLTLKHKLFYKKSSLEQQLIAPQLDAKEISSTVLAMNASIAKDNPTEVPPSPVSVSSSSPDEFFKHASPVSPLDVPFSKEHSPPQIGEGIQPSKADVVSSHPVEATVPEVPSSHLPAYEDEVVETYTHEETFIQEILLALGLYHRGSSSVRSPQWDALSQTVPSWVFEEVEKAHHNPNQLEQYSTPETSVTHRILFDLLNEALPIILKPPDTRTAVKWSRGMCRTIPRGKKLLHAVWREILNLTPCFAEPYLIENLMAHDIGRNSWSIMAEEETGAIWDDIASMILEQLLNGFLLDVCS